MDKQARIEAALRKVGAAIACSRCGGGDFTLLKERVFILAGVSDFETMFLRGSHIPCEGIVCRNCGHVDIHAVQFLHGEGNGDPEVDG